MHLKNLEELLSQQRAKQKRSLSRKIEKSLYLNPNPNNFAQSPQRILSHNPSAINLPIQKVPSLRHPKADKEKSEIQSHHSSSLSLNKSQRVQAQINYRNFSTLQNQAQNSEGKMNGNVEEVDALNLMKKLQLNLQA